LFAFKIHFFIHWSSWCYTFATLLLFIRWFVVVLSSEEFVVIFQKQGLAKAAPYVYQSIILGLQFLWFSNLSTASRHIFLPSTLLILQGSFTSLFNLSCHTSIAIIWCMPHQIILGAWSWLIIHYSLLQFHNTFAHKISCNNALFLLETDLVSFLFYLHLYMIILIDIKIFQVSNILDWSISFIFQCSSAKIARYIRRQYKNSGPLNHCI
jgi:hypothetical protein